MLDIVKKALRITTDAFDDEIQLLIDACLEEMAGLGVVVITDEGLPASVQVQSAIIAYCKWLFGNNEDADRWRDIYHTKLGQLKSMTGYTDWGGEH